MSFLHSLTFDRTTSMDAQQHNELRDQEDFYRQLRDFHPQMIYSNEFRFNYFLNLSRFYSILLIILILTSQSNGLPTNELSDVNELNLSENSRSSSDSSNSAVTVKQSERRVAMPNGKSYRHYSVPSRESFRLKSNDILTSNADDENIIYPSASVIYSKTMEEQLKRERQRRLMVDRILNLFDEDGNGQLTKDEFYSLALRLNVFPKLHSYLKQINT